VAWAPIPKDPCDSYWYSIDNPAIMKCRDVVRTRGRSSTDAIIMILEAKGKLSASDGPVGRAYLVLKW
jgi:hypothetical protein